MTVSIRAPEDIAASAPNPIPAVQVDDLTVQFDAVRAVDGISFRVKQGEVFGLLGPNGAGKTTTIRVLTTLLPLRQGRASIFGMDVRRESMAIRQIIGYVPQQLSIDSSLTGWENVWLFARLFDVPARERKERIAASLDTVGLIDAAHRLARTYSGGMVRRLELAQALINRPRLLIMDEPTIGLDPVARSDVWERVEALRGLLIGTPTNLALDFGVLIVALIAGITAAAALLGRLARG